MDYKYCRDEVDLIKPIKGKVKHSSLGRGGNERIFDFPVHYLNKSTISLPIRLTRYKSIGYLGEYLYSTWSGDTFGLTIS